jgi:hypothetical protein
VAILRIWRARQGRSLEAVYGFENDLTPALAKAVSKSIRSSLTYSEMVRILIVEDIKSENSSGFLVTQATFKSAN